MRDERYYQRLNEIRQKYGYLNEINLEQEPRKIYEKRQTIPPASHQLPLYQQYLEGCNFPIKPQNATTACTGLQTRRAKENNSTPTPPYNNDIETDRTYRQQQITQPRQPLEKQDNYLPSTYPSSFTPLLQKATSNECSSPIKRLQIELSTQITPRQYSQRTKAAQPVQATTNSSYRTQIAKLAERSQKPYDTVIEDPPRRQNKAISCTSTPKAAKSTRETRNIVQDLYNNKESEEFSSKYNASLNNIDKIQQKIQAMLSKPKK